MEDEYRVERIRALRAKLDKLRPAAVKAVQKAQSQTWVWGFIDTVRDAYLAGLGYKPGDRSNKAVYILSQVVMSLGSGVMQVEDKYIYEALQRDLEQLTGNEPGEAGLPLADPQAPNPAGDP